MKARNTIFAILMLAMSCTLKNCGEKEKFPEFVDMIFMIPLTITPVQQNFFVNDTIVIHATFPDSVLEFYTGKTYRLPNLDFKANISFLKLVSNTNYLSEQPGNAVDYQFIFNEGYISGNGKTGRDLLFGYQGNMYKLNIFLVPLKEGVNCIAFLSAYVIQHKRLDDIINLGFTTDGRKRIPLLTNIFFTVNEGENNFTLLKQKSKLAINNVESPANLYGERYGTFTFRVVE
jgi:hypothetical protein